MRLSRSSLEPFKKSVTLSQMQRSFIIALSSLTLCTMQAQETLEQKEKKKPSLAELSKGLGSDDFKKRYAATQEIWELGDSAFDFLVDLEKNKDPELALRASRLLHKLRCGIRPDTPADIVEMLEEYLTADQVAKERIAKQLESGAHYEYLYRLMLVEEEPEFKKKLQKMVFEVIPQMIHQHIVKGEMDQARKFLKLGTEFRNLIHYGNFLQLYGELDDELVRLRELDDEESKARYLAYLRVKGDLPLLQKEALRLGDQSAYATASLLLGDALPSLKLQLEERRLELSQASILKLRIAQLEGDQDAEWQMITALENLCEGRTTIEGARNGRAGLYAGGYIERVEKINEGDDWAHAFEHAQIFDQPKKAAKILGLKKGRLDQEWLEKNLAALLHEWKMENSQLPTYDLLRQALNFFENRGDYEAVSRICRGVFDAAREVPSESVMELIETFSLDCPRGMIPAIAREADEFDLPLGELLSNLLDGSNRASSLLWLYSTARKIDPDLSSQKLMELIMTFQGAGGLSKEDFETWNDRLFARAIEDSDGGNSESLIYLSNLWKSFGPADLRMELFKHDNFPRSGDYFASEVAVDLGLYEDALNSLATLDQETVENSSEMVYKKALLLKALNREDEVAEVQRLEKRAYLLSLGDRNFLSIAAYDHLDYGDATGAYRLIQSAILRTQNPTQVNRDYTYSLVRRLARQAMHLKKWKEASALSHVDLIPASRTENALGIINLTFDANFTHGLALLSDGEKGEAVKILEKAHRINPGSGLLADFFFPELREYGLDAFHDRLCQESLGQLRKVIELFPKDHSSKNTFAWMASRANRNLNEAELMMEDAIQMDPNSPALLDTMAEVQFALGDRESAIQWSEQAFNLRTWDSEIRRQLIRFRSGAFPKP